MVSLLILDAFSDGKEWIEIYFTYTSTEVDTPILVYNTRNQDSFTSSTAVSVSRQYLFLIYHKSIPFKFGHHSLISDSVNIVLYSEFYSIASFASIQRSQEYRHYFNIEIRIQTLFDRLPCLVVGVGGDFFSFFLYIRMK